MSRKQYYSLGGRTFRVEVRQQGGDFIGELKEVTGGTATERGSASIPGETAEDLPHATGEDPVQFLLEQIKGELERQLAENKAERQWRIYLKHGGAL